MDKIPASSANPEEVTPDPNSLTPLEKLNATLTRQEELRREELEAEKKKTAALLEENELEKLRIEQRRRANELAQKQIDLMDEILADLTNLVIYRKSGVLEREIDDLKTLVNRLHYTIEAQILARPIDDKTKLLLKIIRGEADDEVELLLKTIQGDLVNPPRKRGVTGQLTTTTAIDPDLARRLQTTLLNCGVFQSDSELKAIFTDGRISPWQNDVPQSANPQARVQAVISWLWRQTRYDGENGLVLFLQVLRDQKDPGDKLHYDLAWLANELAGKK